MEFAADATLILQSEFSMNVFHVETGFSNSNDGISVNFEKKHFSGYMANKDLLINATLDPA